MSTLMQQVTALRDALREADGSSSDSFSKVFDSFFTLTERSGLMDASERYQDEMVRVLLENVARRHAKDPKLALASAHMLRHAPSGLVHGMFYAGTIAGTFFYFQSEQQGIVAFAGQMSMMHYYRITASVLPGDSVIVRDKPGTKN